jgi:hypothetical protein
MAGLNNLLSDTQQTSTTMPAWYDQAQQAIVNQGTQAAAAAPIQGQTTAQQAINTLQGPNNPFTQAQNTLQQISTGAANPWITDASGNVTPNTNTAMGGLFQAENQQLNQLLPNYTAGAEAAGIGSGNFGSLRGQTAVDKAKADAFSNLTAQQMASALQNQQTGQAAAANLGNVGSQGITSEMNVGASQQNAPFQTPGNLASLLGTLQAPTTVTSQKQLSPLGQIATIGNTLQGGLTGLTNLNGTTAGKNILNSLGLGNLFGNNTSTGSGATQSGSPNVGGGTTPGTYPTADGGTMLVNSDGSKTITAADGTPQYFDAQGNPVSSDQGLQNANIIPDSGLTQQSPSAGDTSSIDNFGLLG